MTLIGITQKVESQNGGYNTKHAKFSEKRTFLTPWYAHTHERNVRYAYQGVRNVCFFEKLGVLCLLVTTVLRFALLPYYRRLVGSDFITNLLQREWIRQVLFPCLTFFPLSVSQCFQKTKIANKTSHTTDDNLHTVSRKFHFPNVLPCRAFQKVVLK